MYGGETDWAIFCIVIDCAADGWMWKKRKFDNREDSI